MIDVENAWEIHHFVQNDEESRQWILRSALNDEEKFQNEGQLLWKIIQFKLFLTFKCLYKILTII
jgi:hypothetical protein